MKKFLCTMFGIAASICFSAVANAADLEGMYDNYQAVYLPSTATWSNGGMAEDRIVLTKKVSAGSGNYSEYYLGNGELAIALNSDYEFFSNGQLIAVNNSALKYSKVVYENNKFKEVPLTDKELKEVFPDAQIIKISQFNNGEISIPKPFYDKRTVLLVNDTDKDFYKYTYTPSTVQTTDVKGLITLSKMGKVKFAHFGDKNTALTIKVKHGKSCSCGCACGCNCGCNGDKSVKCNCNK